MTRDIVHATEIHAEPKTVYDTIASKAGLGSFWTSDVEGDESHGGTLTFGFAQAPTRMPIRVSRLDPPDEITWECPAGYPFWEGTTISWVIAAEGQSTHLVFRHAGFSDEQSEYDFGSVSLTWALIVARLKDVVERGGEPNPFFA